MKDNRIRVRKDGLRAIILDWAGTTVDYGSYAPVHAFIKLFDRRNIPVSVDEARRPMGSNKQDHIRALTQTESVQSRWHFIYGRKPTEEDVEEMYRDFIPIQRSVIAESTTLIPGTLETISDCRCRGLRIGSTTGYNREMMDVLLPKARQLGYEPESTVCATEVPAGRPAPWMAFKSAMQLCVYPMESIVKVGDTILDIAEGLNAGMWTIAVSKTGNELGLTQGEIDNISSTDLASRLVEIRKRFYEAGAHYVVDGIGDVPTVLDEIDKRIQNGDKPLAEY